MQWFHKNIAKEVVRQHTIKPRTGNFVESEYVKYVLTLTRKSFTIEIRAPATNVFILFNSLQN